MDSSPAMSIAVLVLLILGSVAVSPAQEIPDEPDSPLVEATKSFLKTWNQRRNAEQNVAYRERALALADSLEAEEELVLATHCLARAGILSYRFNEMDTALATWERGLEIARRSGDDRRIAALLNAKANGLDRIGEHATALDMQRELLKLRRSLGDARGEAITLNSMALSQAALLQYPEAIQTVRAAMRLDDEAANPFGRALNANLLARLLLTYNQSEEALAQADTAVAVAERLDSPYTLAAILNGRAVVLSTMGRYEEGLADIERSLQEYAAAGYDASGDIVRVNRIDSLVELGRAEEAIDEARAIVSDFSGSRENNVLARATLGRALMHAGRNDEARTVLEEAVGLFQALQDSLEGDVARADASRFGGAVTYLALMRARGGQVGDAWNLVEVDRSRTIDGLARADLERFQGALAARDAVALDFGYASAEGCPTFLVTPDSVVYREIQDVTAVRWAAVEFGELLDAGSESERFAEVRSTLSDMLLGPFRAAISAGQRIVIVPGAYAGIPFEALDLGDGTDLGEACAISYAPSASRFVTLDERIAEADGFVGFADATTDTTRATGLWVERIRGVAGVALPESRAEVRGVAPAGGSLYVGSDATVESFRSSARAAGILHVATHAIVDPRHPDTSALVLATSDDHDGMLLARDISTLELGNDLVCLSACATAGGYRSYGEGAFGLTRAFFESGARTVVSTWWDVEDRAARRFMELFYAGLRENLDRDEAARRARIAMREEGFSRRDRVSFAVSGAVTGSLAGVLGKPRSSAVMTILAVAGLLVLLVIAIRRRAARHRLD